jgi:hypothetical protein
MRHYEDIQSLTCGMCKYVALSVIKYNLHNNNCYTNIKTTLCLVCKNKNIIDDTNYIYNIEQALKRLKYTGHYVPFNTEMHTKVSNECTIFDNIEYNDMMTDFYELLEYYDERINHDYFDE